MAVAEETRILTLSHSPDPDDAFTWWGLVSGRVRVPGVRFEVTPRTMEQANRACLAERVDVAAISSAAWPHFSRKYAILGSGASVGRGYGPAVASRVCSSVAELDRATVALPGSMTTGALLFRLFHPLAATIEKPCSAVAEAIVNGDVEGGVLIHEELMNYAHKGLRRLECLGRRWLDETGLPIPVGLIAVHRRLGEELIARIAAAVAESVECGFRHRDKALTYAMNFSTQAVDGIGVDFVRMFTNEDTLALPEDCLAALRLLYAKAYVADLIPELPPVNPVYPGKREPKPSRVGLDWDYQYAI
ncbi:MAG: MqnA/MqnD/SBP family protein [Sumerlaeia bacterium]